MRWIFAPGLVFAFNVVFCLGLSIWVVALAGSQPWMGLGLSGQEGRVVIRAIDGTSPVPQTALGQDLLGLQAAGLDPIRLSPRDLIEEPDMIGEAAQTKTFFARQGQLHQVLETGQVSLQLEQDGQMSRIDLAVQDHRPIASLPLKFWAQVFVGLVGLLIGAWVVTLRPRDLAAWMVWLTGVGLALSAQSAALYSAREIALSESVFSTASRVNNLGTFLFGIGMLTLFLVYPRQIVPRWVVALPALAISGFLMFVQLPDWPGNLGYAPIGVATTMLFLLLAIGAQVFVNRRDPTARAMLGWLGLSVAVGAGGFVLTTIMPTLLGKELLLEQSTAFLFFLLIYSGIALGVARYRLFDLSAWSFEILFYGLGVALLLLLDAALIFGLSIDRVPAFGIALVGIGMVYLPMRGRIWSWLRRNKAFAPDAQYRRVTEIAHAIDPIDKLKLLHRFWGDLFAPLSIDSLPDRPEIDTALIDNGSALTLAAVPGLPALRLNWADRGRRLFSSRDLERAVSINALIDASLKQNKIYLEAVTTERSRINRDMHDNLGVLLLSALHSSSVDKKDTLIRQTLTDLRDIISEAGQIDRPLGQLVADLRAEMSAHFEAAGIVTDWTYADLPDLAVSPSNVHRLRSLFRESVNNILRHSGASKVVVRIAHEAGGLSLSLADNGKGFDATIEANGNGLRNLAGRFERVGGRFDCVSTPSGTRVSASLPLMAPLEKAAE